jgi:guanosine-3',5'-bis(diphosphate) 3'-pyrophosphohydrolase
MNAIVAVMRAADFAARKHADQRRKGGKAEPYLNHLIEVASLVAEATDGDPDAVIAALLHDAVEDQGVTVAEIADLFGPAVASLVAEVTDDKDLPKQVRKDMQIANASHKSDGASIIKLADKTSNLVAIANSHRPGPRSGNGPTSNGREPSCRACRSDQRVGWLVSKRQRDWRRRASSNRSERWTKANGLV